MTRESEIQFVVAATVVAYWFNGTREIICKPCYDARIIKPISFWPLCDEWLNTLCAMNSDYRCCDQCLKEIGTEQTVRVN